MEAKITKQLTRDFVKFQLGHSKTWATNGLINIFNFQTKEEQRSDETIENNGLGFTGIDGEILTSFAKQYLTKGYLSPKQMALVYKKMPKYWMQIIKISDEDKLRLIIAKSLITPTNA